MPFWDGSGWKPIQEQYGGAAKQGLKRCIEALVETPYAELDRWDHASLREWMGQHTSDEGVFLVWEAISMLEQITTQALGALGLREPLRAQAPLRAAADGRLLVLAARRLGRSCGRRLGEAIRGLGGEIVQPATVTRVVVENRAVQGLVLVRAAS